MGFLRRIAGILGLGKEEGSHEVKDLEDDNTNNNHRTDHHRFNDEDLSRLPRTGFSVPVQVAVDLTPVGPILVPCSGGDGGVQGLKWYARRLRIDEDGDVADEFLDEVASEETSSSNDEHHRPGPKFQVKYRARQVIVRNQIISPDGRIQQNVEYQGCSGYKNKFSRG
ncbi:hypothetical protein RJ641_035151 [Dillenia turbinata]|uniref:Uncharacterized protein n=1 Tax=Dillenia turbinata TaxID=194707 RepID=A0AAN8ZED0_9MAGN